MTEVTPLLIKELRSKTGIGIAKCKTALEESNGDIEKAVENLRKAGIASALKKEGRATKEGCIAYAEVGSHIALVEINAETDFVVNNDNFQTFAQAIVEEVAQTQPGTLETFLAQKFSKDTSLTIDQYRATIVQSLGENIQIKRLKIFNKSGTSFGIYKHMGNKILSLVEISGSGEEEKLAKDIAMHIAAENPEYINSHEIPDEIIKREKEIAKEQVKNKPEHILNKIIEGKLNAFYDQVCLLQQKFVKNPDHRIEDILQQRRKETGKDLQIQLFQRWSVGE